MAGGNQSYGAARKLSAAKAREYSIVSEYKLGYRNREDVTNLPPGVLIVGSQNIQTNVSDRIQIRQGYSLDGPISSVNSPVSSSFDWLTRNNGERHLRSCLLTSAGNDGKLQYRYVDSSGTVTWRDLLTSLTLVSFNYTTFWNVTEAVRECLFVNGQSRIQSWNGAIATLASVDNTAGRVATIASAPTAGGTGYVVGDVLTITTGGTGATVTVGTIGGSGAVTAVSLTTPGSGYSTGTGKATSGGAGTGATIDITAIGAGQITISGTTSVLNLGFYSASHLSLIINGNTYTYLGIVGNSFIGISPDATGEGVGSIIIQSVVTINNSTMSGITATFANGLISTLNNQIFVGALNSSVVWISKVNSYIDYTNSTPRQTGEGASLILDDQIVAFIPQENYMYVSAGQDLWYNISFQLQTSTVGVTYEQVSALPLKTGRQQGTQSQAMTSHMKNYIIMVTNEPTIDLLGRLEDYFGTPMTQNISDPIKLDVDTYDFTDASIFYFQYYIYVTIPKEGLVLSYDLNTKTWDSPQTLPISRFYIVNGELYGHSYNTSESYKLFTGYADRVYPGFAGYPIDAKAKFSYQNYGTRYSFKNANAFYIEGYISPNTTLGCAITYELDGCATTKTFTVIGSDTQIVCIPIDNGSLGKSSLGKEKLGGNGSTSIQNLPPKFRVEKTFNNTNFFECSFSFEILGVSQRFELLAYGLKIGYASEEPTKIRQ